MRHWRGQLTVNVTQTPLVWGNTGTPGHVTVKTDSPGAGETAQGFRALAACSETLSAPTMDGSQLPVMPVQGI